MRNELQQHKKSDKIKWIATAVAFVLLGTAVLATATKGFKDWKPWKDTKQEQNIDENSTQEAGAYDENGNNLADGNVHDLPLALTFMGAKTLASGTSADITENEDGTKSVTVQATLNLDVDVKIDWSVFWTNTKYATGNISDFLSIEPQTDGAKIATLTMKKRFVYPATLSATVRGLSSVTASCKVDYAIKNIEFDSRDRTYNDSIVTNAQSVVSATKTGFSINPIVYAHAWGTSGNHTFTNISGNYDLSFVDTDSVKKEGYGFAGIVATGELSQFRSYNASGGGYDVKDLTTGKNISYSSGWLACNNGVYSDELRFEQSTVTLENLKNCFYADEGSEYTKDSFYLQGVDLLKTLNTYSSFKLTINLSYTEEGEEKTNVQTYYFAVNASALEGLTIDINGMEDVTF